MDSRFFLAFSLCFLCSFPLFARSANRLPKLLLDDTKTEDSVIRMKMDGSSIKIDPTRVVQLSSQPRAFLYKGFLSAEECQHLIDLAKDYLEQSLVVDDITGASRSSTDRTSTGMFLYKAQDDIVAGIEAKIAAWTFLPVDNGEPIQILRYENGQQYVPHFDFFQDPVNVAAGGHRIATVLMYLSNVERGGETVFPDSPAKVFEEENKDLSDCSTTGYGVKPKKGDALLFFSLHPNVTTDPTSYHGSCPVIEGEKWSATKWIHMLPVDEIWRNPDCVDENEHCSAWAKAGECEKNPGYMVGSSLGSKEDLGYCRLSCKACSPPS
ncbi:probable prolyl 4-hydroxylase 7 [Cucurbita pepo subsp. pepo]|uniref:probable prolyl 4-hydroxylase 7 n=1 Tax=Cucurbita pepo subsp. pepo TaxID=3664 RepID=UPI000C9D5D76|nr:probable prolyl 4-hydroxylase 7 [Cucurbita pepo subsp. pepo]XP_023530716.1 probable prolyl 4-hydroxylase 7 [Cucurbita pepo subsp. pepo]